MKSILTIITIILSCVQFASFAMADNKITFYAYHKIDEVTYNETNISLGQFKAHINELINNNYNVISLVDAVDLLRNKKNIPDKSVVITFDGGNVSAYKIAFPILEKNKLPYSVFVATDFMDRNNPSKISWKELKTLKKSKLVTIGINGASYRHLRDNNKINIAKDVNKAIARYKEEMGEKPFYFSYPFGENSTSFIKIIENINFEAALGQQSGAASHSSNLNLLPRYSMTESHAGMDRYRLTLNTLPLLINEIDPNDNFYANELKAIGFSLDDIYKDNAENISCFGSDMGRLDTVVIDDKRVEIRIDKEINNYRFRINCTMPVNVDGETLWHWHGMLFTIDQD